LIVERVDFISVPVTDMERSKVFYGETLGLDLVVHGEDQGFPEYQLGENVSLYLLDMKNVGSEFTAPHTASIAFRVPDVEEARLELEAKGVTFDADTLDTSVCHMAFFRDPDGNALMLHRRYAPTA
jgi:catechol 2,3-dioxygenase-like lactoylglutathione lyase family enzyme